MRPRCGKPKAGKSQVIRNLTVAVVKGRKFLERSIDIPAGTGKVLYLHLDRKDKPWRVAMEFRSLGITEAESHRIILRTEADIEAHRTQEQRFGWLASEVMAAKPNLVVIDLLWQFLKLDNSNDYIAVLDGINALQDTLSGVGYQGALIVALHSRKASNPDDPMDNMLGSTGQRGSFGTILMLNQHKAEAVYTITSDQTDRDEHWGEMAETIITRDRDGTLTLGRPYSEIAQQQKTSRAEAELMRLVTFVQQHQGADMDTIMNGLAMSKKQALRLVDGAGELIRCEGRGVKGDPHLYFTEPIPHPLVADTEARA